MTYNPDIHHRRSTRLREYDYSLAGAYFVTICCQGRECLFGDVVDREMLMNDAGRTICEWWLKLPDKFAGVELHECICMPNHFHGIIALVGAAPCGRPGLSMKDGHPHGGAPTLGGMIDWFKTMTTNAYINGVKHSNWPSFPGRLWQRNYYDRVIRNDLELSETREYILSNPANWANDDNYS